jgi:hypothetical protein
MQTITEPVKSVAIWEIGAMMRSLGESAIDMEYRVEELKAASKAWESQNSANRKDALKKGNPFISEENPYEAELNDYAEESAKALRAAYDAVEGSYQDKLNSIGLIRKESDAMAEICKVERDRYGARARVAEARKARLDALAKYALLTLPLNAKGEPPAVKTANFSKVGLENTSAQAKIIYPCASPGIELPEEFTVRTITVSGTLENNLKSEWRIIRLLGKLGLAVDIAVEPNELMLRPILARKAEAEKQIRESRAEGADCSEEEVKELESVLFSISLQLNGVDCRLGERPQRVAWR